MIRFTSNSNSCIDVEKGNDVKDICTNEAIHQRKVLDDNYNTTG